MLTSKFIKMRNTKVIYILLVLGIITAIGIIIPGCSEDRLDIKPKGVLLEPSFFNNEEDVYRALVSAYDPISWLFSWGMSYWVQLNAASDDANAGGNNASDQPCFVQADRFNIDVTDYGAEELWRKYYAGVYRCNIIFYNVEAKPELQTPAVNMFLGEARFLRAYYYFDLVRFFGKVPLIDRPIGSEDYAMTRAEISDIFGLIVSDLELAVPVLPVNAPEKGRVDKGAALALLGKAYLFMSSPYFNLGDHYQDAANAFGQLIALNKYELMENYADNFDLDYEFGSESIFELNYNDLIGLDWDASNPYPRMEGNIDIQLCGIRSLVQTDTVIFSPGWGFIKPTQEIAQVYLDNNEVIRYNASIISGDSLEALGMSWTDNFDYEGYFRMKYAPMAKDEPANTQAWANNFRVIRLADVYLMLAECIVNGASDPGGQDADHYVNEVRERAGVPLKSGVTMNDIRLERQLELSFEAVRYWDVLRWNLGDEIFGNHKADLDREWNPAKRGLWPIPQTEIERTGGSLDQNDGYN
jgi:hypothetical protein